MIEPRTSSIGTAGKTIFSAVVKLPEENKTKTIDITDDVKEIQEFVSSIPNGTPGDGHCCIIAKANNTELWRLNLPREARVIESNKAVHIVFKRNLASSITKKL